MKIEKLVEKLGKSIKKIKDGIDWKADWKTNWKKAAFSTLYALFFLSSASQSQLSARTLLSGNCYNGYKKIVRVYDPANPTDTLTDSVGVDHADDCTWRVWTANFDTGTVVNIDFLDSTNAVVTRTKQKLEFPFFGDYGPTTFYDGHSVYGEIFPYISPDSSDTVFAHGSKVTAHVSGKDSCPLSVYICQRIDDYHGDINNIPGIQIGDTVSVKLRKQKENIIYGKDTSFVLKKIWEPPLHRIDATNIDLQLQPIDTLPVEEKDKSLENKVKCQVYPIPFTKEVYIKRPEDASVTSVKVYDVSGRYVSDIKGNKWNFKNKQGKKVKKGIYFFEINYKGKKEKEIRKGIYLG